MSEPNLKRHRLALPGLASAVIATALGLAGCDQGPDQELTAQVKALTQQLKATQTRLPTLDGIKEIEKLTRTYGYYIDKGMWSHVVDVA